MTENDLYNEQLDFFCKEKIKFHADLKDGQWLNGYVLKNTKQDIWWIKEDKLGEIFLFTKSILKLHQFIFKDVEQKGGQNEMSMVWF
ncbi:MAG TPA: hypothetical protein VJ438_02215 [Candidatus Nanoarchaeia archaeon]|nr:hypothetical protein [Candidatus Nanoarchaeia archaeon]